MHVILRLVIIILILIGIYLYKYEEIWESLQIFLATKLTTREYYTEPPSVPVPSLTSPPDTPSITWLGHSTFLIQVKDTNLLTDPIFGDLSFMYPRKSPCGLRFDQLPTIHVVLISHNHRDHFDKPSLRLLRDRDDPLIVTPRGLRDIEFPRIVEVPRWWQTTKISTLTLTLLPAKHWSNRGLFDVNHALCGSWMINEIYFAGDSAYGPHYKAIAQHFPEIQVALLPIGPNEPDHLMRRSHMSTEQAGQAFLDLNAKTMIPMHWGTFELGTDTFDSPLKRLDRWWTATKKQVGRIDTLSNTKQVVPLRFGQQFT